MQRLLLMACVLAAVAATAAPVELKRGDRVAFFGDSITHQASYTAMLETYFELCTGVKDLTFMQFGWCGDTAGHARERMADDVLAWKATVATVFFGVNDGKYKPYDEGIAMLLKTNLTEMVRTFKTAGVRPILASPPSMDPSHGDGAPAFVDALTRMGAKAREVASEQKVAFADVNRVHRSGQERALADFGATCKFSADGVHGYPASHFLIFHGFLEGFRLNGQVASVTMDLKGGKTAVSDGHSVVTASPGRAEIESTRYPFCFKSCAANFGDDLRAMLRYVDFQQRYNRFELRAKGLGSAKAKVVWSSPDGKSFSREFTAAELSAGVNLAAAFEGTPFDAAFATYFEAAWRKEQNDREYATRIIPFKQTAAKFTGRDFSSDLQPVFDAVFAKQAEGMAKVKALHVPVRHVIEVIPVK